MATTYTEMLDHFKKQAESDSPQAGLFALAAALLWIGYSADRIADIIEIESGVMNEVAEGIGDIVNGPERG